MNQLWTIDLPERPRGMEFLLYGKFFSFEDIHYFFYLDSLTNSYYYLRFMTDGTVLAHNSLHGIIEAGPATWIIPKSNPDILVCGKKIAFQFSKDEIKPVFNLPTTLTMHYNTNAGHLEDDSFYFGSYRLDHKGAFGFRCRHIETNQTLWELSLRGYLYSDPIQLKNSNTILFCTAGFGGSLYAVDLLSGEIKFEVKTGGTRDYALYKNRLYCYQCGKNGELIGIQLSNGVVVERIQLHTVDIDCPLKLLEQAKIIALSRKTVKKDRWVPVLTCVEVGQD